jgi:hypothetical protein
LASHNFHSSRSKEYMECKFRKGAKLLVKDKNGRVYCTISFTV